MPAKPSSLIDTRVIYCGDNLDQLRKLPNECIDLIYIDPSLTRIAIRQRRIETKPNHAKANTSRL